MMRVGGEAKGKEKCTRLAGCLGCGDVVARSALQVVLQAMQHVAKHPIGRPGRGPSNTDWRLTMV